MIWAQNEAKLKAVKRVNAKDWTRPNGDCKQVLGENMTSSTDVRPCSDVTVASDAQLQQQLLQEIASRKAAEHRAICLHQLLADLRNRKVWFMQSFNQSILSIIFIWKVHHWKASRVSTIVCSIKTKLSFSYKHVSLSYAALVDVTLSDFQNVAEANNLYIASVFRWSLQWHRRTSNVPLHYLVKHYLSKSLSFSQSLTVSVNVSKLNIGSTISALLLSPVGEMVLKIGQYLAKSSTRAPGYPLFGALACFFMLYF